MIRTATTRRQVRIPRPKLSPFATRLLAAWKTLRLTTSDTSIVLAVSGGADSTALLLGVEELTRANKLNLGVVVAHLDHGLRKESKADARWVKRLATKLGFESVNSRKDVKEQANKSGENLEQAARRARYEFFARIAKRRKASCVLTAHTMDDQAETILLRLLRGSGTDGMTGIEPMRRLDAKSSAEIILARPLLTWARRADTEAYCQRRQINYLSDSMNKDEQFTRVRVRRQLLPLMESFNKKIVEGLSRTAELLRDEVDVLTKQAQALLVAAAIKSHKGETKVPALDVRVLAEAPVAVRRRALRQWIAHGRGDLRRCELVHIQGIEKLLVGQQGGRVAELPGGATVVRKQSRLELVVGK
ncbi:MAG TPA: tRNA lysidine(34) synthetase TilS [Pyrinomonadaceae bacterium]|nr:tRNA lysidine(34) synthetase TilS [Pyrinomonadaceae bacterium]